MSYCFGFISNDEELIQCALTPFAAALRVQQGAPNGWGLSYYQSDNPLLKKQPMPMAEPLDFADRAANLRTRLMLGHVRGAQVSGLRTENTQPFRYRAWTFCHMGTLDRFESVEQDLLESVPVFLRRNIRGNTDSEAIFHLFLSFLNDTGKLHDPRIGPEIAARALQSTFAFLDRIVTDSGGRSTPGCCMVTNGLFLVALGRDIPLSICRHATYSCPDVHGKPTSVKHLQAAMLVAGASPADPGWERLADNPSLVYVDPQLNIKSGSL